MTGNLFIPMDFGLNTPGQPGIDDGTQRPWLSDKPNWYLNNSIWLDPGVTSATVGQPTHVKVRVSNKGAQAMEGVQVEAWLFNPGIGDMKPPGFRFFQSKLLQVPAGGSAVFTCDTAPVWVPDETDLAKTNGGHACIIANCYQSDQFVADPEGKSVDHGVPVAPSSDQHQGQRNIQIIKVQEATASEPQHVRFVTHPPINIGHREYLVSATHVRPRIAQRFDPTTEFVLTSQEGVEAFEPGVHGGTGLNLITSNGPVEIKPATEPPSFKLRAEGMPKDLGTRFRFQESRADQIDSEMSVQLPPGAEVGSLHSFDIGMWDENDELVGSGMRVLVLVTE